MKKTKMIIAVEILMLVMAVTAIAKSVSAADLVSIEKKDTAEYAETADCVSPESCGENEYLSAGYEKESADTDDDMSSCDVVSEENNYYIDNTSYENNYCVIADTDDIVVENGEETAAAAASVTAPEAGTPEETAETGMSEETAGSPEENAAVSDPCEAASVRTSVIEFEKEYPTVGATDVTVRSKVLNRSGGTITRIGCVIYRQAYGVVGSVSRECSISDEEFTVSYEAVKDMGIELERGKFYTYRFFAEYDGEYYTNDELEFHTNKTDDRFMIEYMKPEVSSTNVRISAKIYNPTGAKVSGVKIKAESCRDFYYYNETIAVDSTDEVITVSYDCNENGEIMPSNTEFNYRFIVLYEDKEYMINQESFITQI